MQLLTPIGEYSFLANLDRLEVLHTSTGQNEYINVDVYWANNNLNNSIYKGKIFLNKEGRGTLNDLAGIIEPYISHTLSGKISIHLAPQNGSSERYVTTVLYSTTRVDLDAKYYLEHYYLTKRVEWDTLLPQQKQYLHFYAPEECSVVAALLYEDGAVEETIAEMVPANTLFTIDCSPSKFERAGRKLLGYAIKAGERVAEFAVDYNTPDRELQFAFTNSFGVQEVFYCKGEHNLEVLINRSSGSFNGLLENYDIDEKHEHKFTTGYLINSLSYWVKDFVRSKEIYIIRDADNLPVVLLDSKIIDSTDSTEVRNYEFKLQPAAKNHNTFELKESGRIFDHTFDQTFN